MHAHLEILHRQFQSESQPFRKVHWRIYPSWTKSSVFMTGQEITGTLKDKIALALIGRAVNGEVAAIKEVYAQPMAN